MWFIPKRVGVKYVNTCMEELFIMYQHKVEQCKRVGQTPNPRQITPWLILILILIIRGAWWLIGRFEAFRPKGRGFEYRCSRHVGSLGKSFTRSCLWLFGVKLRHSICAVFGALLGTMVDLKRRHRNNQNEWMNRKGKLFSRTTPRNREYDN